MDLNKKIWQWIVLIFMAFIWGASFILMKKGLESYSNYQVAAFRVFFSFIFLAPLIYNYYRKFNRSNIKALLVVGVIGTGLPAILFTTAQTSIDSSMAGMLNSLTALFTLIIGILLYKSNFKLLNVLGVLIGLIGSIGLILNGNLSDFRDINWYGLFVVAATICYGVSANEIKNNLKQLNALEITSLTYLVIGPVGGIYLLFSDFSTAVTTENHILNLVYIAILALFGSVIAIIAFNALIKYTTAIFAASVTYIIPIFAIFWGIFDGEIISLIQILSIGVILLGVYLVNRNK